MSGRSTHRPGGARRNACKPHRMAGSEMGRLTRERLDARIRRHSAHPADARPGVRGQVRVSVVSQRSRRPRLGVGNQRDDSFGRVDARRRRQGQTLGDGGLHLERTSRAWTGRGFARLLSGGVQAGHGRAGGDAGRHGFERASALGGRPSRAPICMRSSFSLRETRRNTIAASQSTRSSSPTAPALRSSLSSTFRPFLHLIMRTIILATATVCRSRSSRARARSLRPAPGIL